MGLGVVFCASIASNFLPPTTALKGIKFLGFTNGNTASSIDYGANCVLLKTSVPNLRNPYTQIAAQLPQTILLGSNSKVQGPLLRPNSGGNPWDFIASPDHLTSHDIQSYEQQQTVIEPLLKNQYL